MCFPELSISLNVLLTHVNVPFKDLKLKRLCGITYSQFFIAWVGLSHLYCSDVSEIAVPAIPRPSLRHSLPFNGMDHWIGRWKYENVFTWFHCMFRRTVTYAYIVYHMYVYHRIIVSLCSLCQAA